MQQVFKFIINGLIATFVHYMVLYFNMEVIRMTSATLANLIGASFGITVSFFGNRNFVFLSKNKAVHFQAMGFITLQSILIAIQSIILFIWVDLYDHNYQIVFIFAVGISTVLSYTANKLIIFR